MRIQNYKNTASEDDDDAEAIDAVYDDEDDDDSSDEDKEMGEASCGGGVQRREATCVRADGRTLHPAQCAHAVMPTLVQPCEVINYTVLPNKRLNTFYGD